MQNRLPFWEWYRVIKRRRWEGIQRYNRKQCERVQTRRQRILEHLSGSDSATVRWGLQTQLAELFGVDPATISRDFRALGLSRSGS